jgi:hypothetical protein
MHRQDTLTPDRARGLASGLGWFSIALGAVELFSPRTVTRHLGMEGAEQTVAMYGLREIVTGIGILSSSNPAPWIWGRVAGDGLDLMTLAGGMRPDNPQRSNVGAAMVAVAGIAAADWICARSLGPVERVVAIPPVHVNYGSRSGFPGGMQAARGAARDFEIPRDFRTPDLLRPLDQTRH